MEKSKNITAVILISAGILMMAAGIYHGELSLILNKATRICLECVGIG